ncbi:hypothetical protein PPH41_18650, partial [Burkholderia gladioli]|nr:hypothetical protein [Burkholderia gladioli]
PGNACIFHLGTSMPLARGDPPSFALHSGVGRVHIISSKRLLDVPEDVPTDKRATEFQECFVNVFLN